MFHSNKLFAFTLLALVATASARPIDLPSSQNPSSVTHSLNSTPTIVPRPVTSTLIVDSSLSAPTQVPTLTDHKAISTMPAPVLPVTPSVTTATTLPTGTPAVPSTSVDPRVSNVRSDAVPSAAPQDVYCLANCHLLSQGSSPVDVPEHTMTSSVNAPILTVPTTTDLHATESLPSAMSSSPSALPTTTVAADLGAQTPAARVVETSATSVQVVETPALATPATTTVSTSASALPVSASAVNPPSSAPSASVPVSAPSLPASVPVSAPSPPAMSPTIPTNAIPSAPAIPTTPSASS